MGIHFVRSTGNHFVSKDFRVLFILKLIRSSQILINFYLLENCLYLLHFFLWTSILSKIIIQVEHFSSVFMSLRNSDIRRLKSPYSLTYKESTHMTLVPSWGGEQRPGIENQNWEKNNGAILLRETRCRPEEPGTILSAMRRVQQNPSRPRNHSRRRAVGSVVGRLLKLPLAELRSSRNANINIYFVLLICIINLYFIYI